MDSEKIYRRLTENIQNKMAKYKEGKSTKDSLNDQLIINISSLCRFLRKREEEKIKEDLEREKRRIEKDKLQLELDKIHKSMIEQEKKEKAMQKKSEKPKKKTKTKPKLSEEMLKLKNEKNEVEKKMKLIEEEELNDLNQTILDVFVPYSRLTKSLQLKLESITNPIIEEENEGEKEISLDGEAINLDNSLDHEKIANLIANEDAEEDAFDADGDLLMKNANTDYLTNDELSISMSLFNKPLGFDDFDNNDNNILKKNPLPSNEKESIVPNKNNDPNINPPEKMSIKFEVNKEEELKLANEEFKNILKPKVIKEVVNEMSYDYIKYMYILFQKMKKKSNEDEIETNQSKSLNFINQFKSFILDIGISDKKFYEQCIREIIYNKNELEFGEFLECFKKLINLKFDQTFLKFKFLFHITEREEEEYFKKEELENYFNLLQKCKKLYEPEIIDEIKNKLIQKYKKIFPGNDKMYTRKLSLVLEQFFDLK
jgi:hypothetical protein